MTLLRDAEGGPSQFLVVFLLRRPDPPASHELLECLSFDTVTDAVDEMSRLYFALCRTWGASRVLCHLLPLRRPAGGRPSEAAPS